MQTNDQIRVPGDDDDVQFPRTSSVSYESGSAQNRLSLIRRHLDVLNALRPRIPQHSSSALKPIRYGSRFARTHFTILLVQAYLHLPATVFFDYNALYVLVQIAFHPDQGQNSSTAWWIASGIYGACFLTWLIVVVVIWEIVLSYRRRWVIECPFAMPIYCSSSAFTLTATRSFSLYSLLYRTRLSASRTDLLIETCWFYSQNWPTILSLLPRAVILAIVLALYNPISATARPTLSQDPGSIRDPVYFDIDTGLLTRFSYVILLVYAGWIVWRGAVLLASWLGLFVLLGPRFAFDRERDSYLIECDDADMEVEGTFSQETRQLRAPSIHYHRPVSIPQEDGEDRDPKQKRRSVRMSSVTIAGSEKETVREHVASDCTRVRVRPASIDVPRSSQSLRKAEDASRRGRSDALEHSRQDAGKSSVIRSTTPATRSKLAVFRTPSMAVDDAPWAWRSRAEERMRVLLTQCRSAIATDDEWFEWVEIPRREAGPIQPMVSQVPRRSADYDRHIKGLHDSGGGIASLQLAERSVAYHNQDDQMSVDELTEAPPLTSLGARSTRRRLSTSSYVRARHCSASDNFHSRDARGQLANEPNSSSVYFSKNGNEELRYHDRDEDDHDDAASMNTEDSEERRIWSAFPEQSRRHPPGLIAVEMQHRQMGHRRRFSPEEESRERESSVTSTSTNSASTVSAPLTVAALPVSPPMPSGQATEDSLTHGSNVSLQLPVSPSEGLLPIEEESWTSSSSSSTDDDRRFVRSYLPTSTQTAKFSM